MSEKSPNPPPPNACPAISAATPAPPGLTPTARSVRWHTQYEAPPPAAEPVTALIAVRGHADEEPVIYLRGMYYWKDGRWLSETYGTQIDATRYWWIAEDDLIELLCAQHGTARPP